VSDCIFCAIVKGEVPARIVHRDDRVVAFHDIRPVAPVHVLVVPTRHSDSILEAAPDDVAAVFETARRLGRELDPEGRGFRLVVNTGAEGGQTVGHLHCHVLAGRPFTWPPG
jgi:histidine triad (HIT) family protein